jgi:hypothetical protein
LGGKNYLKVNQSMASAEEQNWDRRKDPLETSIMTHDLKWWKRRESKTEGVRIRTDQSECCRHSQSKCCFLHQKLAWILSNSWREWIKITSFIWLLGSIPSQLYFPTLYFSISINSPALHFSHCLWSSFFSFRTRTWSRSYANLPFKN